MTPCELCKAILTAWKFLPEDWRTETMRVYATTWSIVSLYNCGLAKPTDHAKARLRDLLLVVNRKREEN